MQGIKPSLRAGKVPAQLIVIGMAGFSSLQVPSGLDWGQSKMQSGQLNFLFFIISDPGKLQKIPGTP
jgi:hypothetical protein